MLEKLVRPKTNSRQDGAGHEMNICSLLAFFNINSMQLFSE